MSRIRRNFAMEAAKRMGNGLLSSARSAGFGLIIFLLLGCSSAFAHEMRPAYLELRETKAETYDVLWKVPGRGDNLRLGLYVEFPADCKNLTEPRGSMINRVEVAGLRLPPLPHHPACGSAPGGSNQTR